MNTRAVEPDHQHTENVLNVVDERLIGPLIEKDAEASVAQLQEVSVLKQLPDGLAHREDGPTRPYELRLKNHVHRGGDPDVDRVAGDNRRTTSGEKLSNPVHQALVPATATLDASTDDRFIVSVALGLEAQVSAGVARFRAAGVHSREGVETRLAALLC
jgi:hypothetical protein